MMNTAYVDATTTHRDQKIFTMKENIGYYESNNHDLSTGTVPLSYSSADSATEYASLFGEAIISKDTLCTNTVVGDNGSSKNINDESINTMTPSIDPVCPSLCSDDHENTNEAISKREMTKHSLILPPLKDGSASPKREPLKTVSSTDEQLDKSNEFLDVISCPCYQQCLYENNRTTESKDLIVLNHYDDIPSTPTNNILVLPKIRSFSLFTTTNDLENDEDDEKEEEFQLDEELMTGTLDDGSGAHYRITQIIVEGWLHKKGTGHDWIGSRGWKARWARLAIGYIEGYDNVEVPLLGISWFPTSASYSTVIVLDSAVVLAVDLPNKDKPHRFEVRHASTKRNNSSLPVTRTFTAASRKARDAWVYAISQALLSYEKEKAALRKVQQQGNSPTKSRSSYSHQQQLQAASSLSQKTRDYDEKWLNDRYPPPTRRRSPSPTPQQTVQDHTISSSSPQQHNQQHRTIQKSSSPSSIIGQDGLTVSVRIKPAAIHNNGRSTSV
jgi:hypothetical protein